MQNINPLPLELSEKLGGLNALQLAWLSGYAWAKASQNGVAAVAGEVLGNALTAETAVAEPITVAVLSASSTGNAKSVADKLAESLKVAGVAVNRSTLGNYKAKNIADEKAVILVTSTQGDGEVPEEAVPLFKLLNGKKAPKLNGVKFAVLGLGDTSYPNFCKAGKDFDALFEKLGGERIFNRQDFDLDFKVKAEQAITDLTTVVKDKTAVVAAPQTQSAVSNSAVSSVQYNRENPLTATLITNQKITGRESAKDVRHLEFDLGDSGFSYTAGDALGVYFTQSPALVDEILVTLKINDEGLRNQLINDFEITAASQQFIQNYNALANNSKLAKIIKNSDELAKLASRTQIVDVLKNYPPKKGIALTAEQFTGLLKPITPRFYSISSSQTEVGEEVHLTVGVVNYEANNQQRFGACSGFLSQLPEDSEVRIFVEQNNQFRLPQDNSKNIILIGSGSGIAPLRAFVQERAAQEATGENWLFFGNQHFTQDFLYQTEWQQFAKDGYLHRYDFAWSRDQAEKIYVQDKIRERAADVWQWLENGAYVYVCGDAATMAKDVDNALIQVIAEQGKLSAEDAEEYVLNLREDGRYQRDVY